MDPQPLPPHNAREPPGLQVVLPEDVVPVMGKYSALNKTFQQNACSPEAASHPLPPTTWYPDAQTPLWVATP